MYTHTVLPYSGAESVAAAEGYLKVGEEKMGGAERRATADD